jgi:ribose transport system substrate-binding protein
MCRAKQLLHFQTMKNNTDVKSQDSSRKVDKYWVPIIARTIDLLDCFGSASKPLTLEEVVKTTGIPHTTAYRILHTLVLRDYLNQSGRQYRLNQLRRRLKFGFANLSKQVCLAVEIEQSLKAATAAAGIDLLVWDNDRNSDLAIQNAREMAASKVDLAIEFQLFENVAPVIADILSRSEIPLISLVNPHHGTVYFGVNNYRAGFAAGTALADYALRHWKSQVDALLLLESPRGGRTIQSRLVGALQGLQERLGPLPEKGIHHLDGGGDKATSRAAVAAFLKSKTRKRILVVGINDESAIGAIEAADQARYGTELAVVGHGGSLEIIDIAADPDSPCIGTVCFHPERYGPDLLNFVLPIVRGRSAPVVHYVPHEFLGKEALMRQGRTPATARLS